MGRDEIMSHLRSFFAARLPAEALERFETLKPAHLMASSMEALDLVLHLEEQIGIELGLAEIGPAVASMTFAALADEIQRMVSPKAA
jgi:acyl carrier protein